MRLSALTGAHLPLDPEVVGITADSRRVRPGWLFAALPGSAADGRRFIGQAVAAGAVAVIAPEGTPDASVPMVTRDDARRAYALAAAALHGRQPETVVAVTGTNGKTSVATFCRQIFETLGHVAASMGTLGVQVGQEAITPPGLTTPDAADVAEMMARLAERGVTHLALEASSHGVDQRRLDGVRLTAAGFTNLSQDHLDYHGDMASYRDAKLRLFDTLLPEGGVAVVWADDPASPEVIAAAAAADRRVMTVGERGRDLRLVSRTPTPRGQTLTVEAEGLTHTVELPLVGGFQAANALVAAGLCIAAGEKAEDVLAALRRLEGARGRLQRIGARPGGGEAYVDYAHTPDGLATVLQALRPHATGRLIVVFGAGGDRDRGKRRLMGEAAQRYADAAVVTDDNPRSEAPEDIRRAVLDGAPSAQEIGDRRKAIVAGVDMLEAGDVLLVAGKGHEQGQTAAGVTHPFDDVSVVAEVLRG